jgi:hypothetical protein
MYIMTNRMRFSSFLACCAVVLSAPESVRAEAYRGEMNSWGTNWMAADADFGSIWKVTVTSPANRASSQFKFDRTGNWSTNWGTGSSYTNAVKNSSVGQCHANLDPGNSSPGNLTFAEVSGRRYSFNLEGEGHWWYRPYVIMETSGDPTSIAAVSDDHDAQGTNTVTVTIQLSAAKNSEEDIWVRYTTNDWATDKLAAKASGSTTNYTAMIPGQAEGTAVEYYLLSSTMPSNEIVKRPDLCTLRGAKSGTTNFYYTVGTPAADLGNCWHYPDNYEPAGAYMRNPRNAYSNNAIYIYNGNQFQGAGTPGNQTGGTLYHRLVGAGSWTATNLSFDVEIENNKYWNSVIPAFTYGATNEVEYYIKITYSDRDTTWLGTTNNTGSEKYAAETNAQAHPFRFTYGGEPGTEAGFIWHNSNRVNLAEGTVQFWVKIGYAQGGGSNRWVDNARLYFTTNNQPVGVTGKGSGDANTFVATMTFSHVEEDSSENGNAMWWVGTASNLPATGNIRYKIGAWNGGGAQRFAEYNTEGQDDKEFVFTLYAAGAEGLRVNGRNADYTTTKFFVDERAGDAHEVVAIYNVPGSDPIEAVEIFSNLDRRDYTDVDFDNDGIPDGIKPPLGSTITTNDTSAYFRAYPMTHMGGREYAWTGTASKAGAYRLTARYKVQGDPAWYWYSSDGRRDHAIVVSPKKALEMTLYEVNPLTVKATGNNKNGRSTFADLLAGNQDSFTNFNLGYLDKLQVNCLWFQPIHPSAITTRGDPSGYDPGSPYATRDYYSVASIMGRADTEAGALSEFTNFVYQCDTYAGDIGPVHIMLDGVFNHTAWDAVMGQGGVDLGFAANPADSMPGTRPGWYSYWQDYGEPANYYNGVYDNDIAVAPDRGDFGKWEDTADLYFGKYSALVRNNPENNGDYLNEDDIYDFAGMSSDTIDLWKYFAYYTEYWLKMTGHPTNNNSAAYDDRGIDALRCDFGQGLPPQLWEYIINRTRKMKWNFVFMAETLDGGKPGYRSNRHFDILNENIVFKFTQEHINDSWQLREALEDRRNAYSSGAILLNLTGHDEEMPDNDPWLVASRYGAVSTVEGLPMIFYGQEWGIQKFNPADPDNKNDGFLTWHEQNFGKYIPHFKQWNKLTVWENPPDYSDGLAQWYGYVNRARHDSPALRSHNRYFLNKVGGGEEGKILAVAKYEHAYGSPATSDVVIAFALMLRHGESHAGAAASYDLQGAWGLLGLDTGKTYRVRNIASSDPSAYIASGWPQTGQQLWDNGIFVQLDGGTASKLITEDGELVQYLKLEEVTSYTLTASAGANGSIIPAGDVTVDAGDDQPFTIAASNLYRIASVATNGSPIGYVFGNMDTNYVFTWLNVQENGSVAATFTERVTTNSGVEVPWTWLDQYYPSTSDYESAAMSDTDVDGMPAWEEYVAGTDPTVFASVFRVSQFTSSPTQAFRRITISTSPQRHYTIHYIDELAEPAGWSGFGNTNIGVGTWLETNVVPATFTFSDDETADTTTNPPAADRRFYRVNVRWP